MHEERADARASVDAQVIRGGAHADELKPRGTFELVCIGPDGKEKWRDVAHNTVVTVGKNLGLDTILAGAAYTVTGPYLGLISSVSFTGIAASDTMGSHPGWLEAGGANAPTYTAPRKTPAFSAAASGSKTTSAPAAFAITGSGTVKGAFMVLGAGAVSTIADANGVLWSAGLFSTGDKVVGNGDTVNVTYTLSM